MASKKPLGIAPKARLAQLKRELEKHTTADFERLSAHLFSRLLGDIAITVSKSGYQVGADAGTAGLRGRRLRIECKRYQESTALRPRDLAGEVAESAGEDELLEAWVLVATKNVKENERKLALTLGQAQGFPVIVIDWTAPASGAGICALAALCATWPEVVEDHLGKKAAEAARALAPLVGPAVDNLRKDLEVWNIGYKRLREASHEHLKRIWENRQQSRAHLGQDAAGGESGIQLIARRGPLQALTWWWSDPSKLEAPAVVMGLEGVGKTWAALDWIRQRRDDLPIVLLLPSGGFANDATVSVGGIHDLLANSLKRSTKSTLTDRYWQTRVTRLLARPVAEGPTFFLFVDGLNQHPQTHWLSLAQALQSDELAGRVRMIMTCRRSHFEQDLRALAQINPRPTPIGVSVYDDTEFDEVLSLHGMKREQLHEAIRPLARTPRLFPLVVRLKDNDALKSDATVHRLLFEYGRDVLEQREHRGFTPDEWVQWLATRARHHRDQIKQTGALAPSQPPNDLAVSLASPNLTAEVVKIRLSEVVDGHLFETKKVGAAAQMVLRKEAAILGLALALLEILDQSLEDFDSRQSALEGWLEPVGAVDQTTEVLRAALSVIVAGAGCDGEVNTDCLLVTWMNAQNHGRAYQQDVDIFGNALPRSMLAVIEHSSSPARETVRRLAIRQLRKLSSARTADWECIEQRLIDWAGHLRVPRPENLADERHYDRPNYEAIVKRIGTADPGRRVVLGASLSLTYQDADHLVSAIPGILEGHDLTQFPRVFSTAAVRAAAQLRQSDSGWVGLHWLVLVGSADEQKTNQFLNQQADALLGVSPETGVHPSLANRAAAWLLRLSGDEAMETRALKVDGMFGKRFSYEERYEKDPANSGVEPERRHLEAILGTTALPAWKKLDKAVHFLADPSVKVPSDVLAHLTSMLREQTFAGVHSGMHPTAEDHRWEKLRPAAARFVPEKLFEAARQQLHVLTAQRGGKEVLVLPALIGAVAPSSAGGRARDCGTAYGHAAEI